MPSEVSEGKTNLYKAKILYRRISKGIGNLKDVQNNTKNTDIDKTLTFCSPVAKTKTLVTVKRVRIGVDLNTKVIETCFDGIDATSKDGGNNLSI